MVLKKKKEMEVWFNCFHLKKYNQLYISSSFVKHFHIFCFHQNSSFSLKDTDRKFPSNVNVSLSAGLWSLKIKSRGTGIWRWPWMCFLLYTSPYSYPFPQSGSVHLGCYRYNVGDRIFCSIAWMFWSVSDLGCDWLNPAKYFLDMCSVLVQPSYGISLCGLVEDESWGT